MKSFGWDPKKPSFNWKKLVSNKNQELRRLNKIYLNLLLNSKVKIFEREASFIDNESGLFTLQNYSDILGRRYYRTAIYNSVVVGIAGMVGALIIGIPLAYFTTRYQIKGKSLITTLAILALVSPPFIGAYAWITMLGSNGWLRHLSQNF